MNLLFTAMNTRSHNGIILCTSIDNSTFQLYTSGRGSQKIKETYVWSTTLPQQIEMSFFTFNFEWGNQRTEILETEIGFATFFSFFSFFF